MTRRNNGMYLRTGGGGRNESWESSQLDDMNGKLFYSVNVGCAKIRDYGKVMDGNNCFREVALRNTLWEIISRCSSVYDRG